MRLCDVYREPTAIQVLYALLQQRPEEARISHEVMPNYETHTCFVRSHPYRFWFLVKVDGEFVGDIHATENNEVGIFLFSQHRGKGYGAKAVKMFMLRHRPRAGISAVRVPAWLAHVAPNNDDALRFFHRIGFRKVQETLRYG